MKRAGGGGGGGGGGPPAATSAPLAAIDQALFAGRAGGAGRLRGDREVCFHRHDGEHRRRRRNLGIEYLTVPLGIECDRRGVVSQGRRDQDVLVALPGGAGRGYGQIDLERDGGLRFRGKVLLRYAGFVRGFAQRAAACCGQERLELQLMLAIRRSVELRLDVSPERGGLQTLGDHPRETFRSS